SRLAEVEARLVSDVFSRVLAVKIETAMGGSSPTFGPGKGVSIKKPWGGQIVAGPTDGATDYANMSTIRLRWGSKSLKVDVGLPSPEAIQADCDVKATNIILQALPLEIYALVSTHKVAKDLWERIQMLMQGTSLTKQERECKLYDEFDTFAYRKGKTLRDFYLRISLILNDMNMYNMKLEQFQVNTKFLNTLPPEWSKFVTDAKLVRDLYTTNVDQLHAYLGQHEYHANEVRLMHERTSDPLALVSQHQTFPYATSYHTSQFVSQGPSSLTHSISYPVTDTSSLINHNAYTASSSAPQIDYAPMVQHSSEL
nr:hypothetical protein [Tanacetum cinerariifolium]